MQRRGAVGWTPTPKSALPFLIDCQPGASSLLRALLTGAGCRYGNWAPAASTIEYVTPRERS
jgi:hypothetical protein